MLYIKTDWNIPFYNMALEEYIISEFPDEEDYVFFYIHRPSIIIGKHQNTIEEINREYVEEQRIYVARRLSGGGAVYHDEGNLNYSVITKREEISRYDFSELTVPIIQALQALGIPAEASGRNDLTIEGRKFSGGAQYRHKNRLLHHGTLLFNSELGNLSKALKVKSLKIESKGVKSVRSRVANISEYLKQEMSMAEFKEHILHYLLANQQGREYRLTEGDLAVVEQKVRDKFSTWQWNWGESPAFDLQKVDKFPCGIVDVRLKINKGAIGSLHIYGDYFSLGDVGNLAQALTGVRYEKEALREVLSGVAVGEYINGLSNEEFLALLCD